MRYHNITKDDMLNGDGLRAVLWVAGCTHKCKGCHNPVTWDIEGGIPFDDAAKEELFEAIKPDYISGVTFSGGDPLHPANHVEVAVLAKEIKESEIFRGSNIAPSQLRIRKKRGKILMLLFQTLIYFLSYT